MPKRIEVRVRLHPVCDRTRKLRHGCDQAFSGRKSGHQNEYVSVLQGGHTRCILVECVENPTDGKPTPSLCDLVADAVSLVGRPSFPHAHPRAGGNDYFDGKQGVERGHEWLT